MNSSIRSLAISFVLLVLARVEIGAQQSSPTLSVHLVLSSAKYLMGEPSDPITAELTIKNTGNQPIVTSAGFSQKPFHLFLIFVGPDGKPITAAEAGEGVHEGGPPKIVPVGNAYLQVEEIEILPIGFQKIITIPDLRAFYNLDKAGRYTVHALIPFRTYATFFTLESGNFASIDAFNFAGALQTETVRLSLIADADGDGYAFPEPDSRISGLPVPDCDDNSSAVNPGMSEIIGDGKDNDCNPTTPDAVEPETLTVQIRIPGTFKIGARGSFPVAILSSATFDATKIDPQSIVVEDAHIQVKGKGAPLASFEDVNKDGRLDLVVHVPRENMTLAAGDNQVVLTGKTIELPGNPNLNIRGVATIKVIP